MGNYLLNKVLEGKQCSFYGKLTSNQSIGRETTQFLWEIYLPKYWKGNYAVFMGNYLLNKVLERKLCSFYGKLPFK